MKKTYSKPEIAFESFSLCNSIAAGCAITNPKDPLLEMTGMGPNGGIGYALTMTCDVDVTGGSGDGEYNGICYHVFSSTAQGSFFES